MKYPIGTLLKAKNTPTFDKWQYCIVLGYSLMTGFKEKQYVLYSQKEGEFFKAAFIVDELFVEVAQ